MKEAKIIPSVCVGEEATYEGFVVLRPPTVLERLKYVNDCGFQADEKTGEFGAQKDQLEKVLKMIEFAKPHFVKVEMKKKSDGYEYKSYEDLDSDPDCTNLIVELSAKVLAGFRPDPNLKA